MALLSFSWNASLYCPFLPIIILTLMFLLASLSNVLHRRPLPGLICCVSGKLPLHYENISRQTLLIIPHHPWKKI